MIKIDKKCLENFALGFMKIELLKVQILRTCIERNLITGENLGKLLFSLESKFAIKVDK